MRSTRSYLSVVQQVFHGNNLTYYTPLPHYTISVNRDGYVECVPQSHLSVAQVFHGRKDINNACLEVLTHIMCFITACSWLCSTTSTAWKVRGALPERDERKKEVRSWEGWMYFWVWHYLIKAWDCSTLLLLLHFILHTQAWLALKSQSSSFTPFYTPPTWSQDLISVSTLLHPHMWLQFTNPTHFSKIEQLCTGGLLRYYKVGSPIKAVSYFFGGAESSQHNLSPWNHLWYTSFSEIQGRHQRQCVGL